MARLPLAVQKARLETAKDLAKSYGGILLTTEYLGVDFKYSWCCSAGHEWEASYYSVVKKRHWCGKCSGHAPDKIARLSKSFDIAKQHSGKCLSNEYINSIEHLTWHCKEGHKWSASLANVSRGKWCPYCAGNKVDAEIRIKEAKQHAKAERGECLTKSYTGNKTPMEWRCEKGHRWSANFNTVVNRKSWCARCRGTERDPIQQLEIANKTAKSKGGRCLSGKYINNRSKLLWSCERDHEWEAPFYSVVQGGSWCPICSDGLRERLVRHTIEQLFDLPFKKKKPNWLVNPKTGQKMELDGYNKKISVAFEHQGEQHSRIVKLFKMNFKNLRSQQDRDEFKRLLCAKNNVLLLEISHDVDPNDFPRWIYERIMQSAHGALLENKMKDWRTIKVTEWIESENYSIDDLRKHAKNKGGNCLSEAYKGALIKHKWQCKHGHTWSAKWDSVNRGTWCPHCSGNIVDPIKQLEAAISIAKSRGGECLATAYERADAKMHWRCANGHEWESKYSHVVQGGSWCPRCREPRRAKNK